MAKHQQDIAKESFWRDILGRQSASGLSVRAFCRQEKFTESAFYAWRRTIEERDGAATPPAFVPAEMSDDLPVDGAMTIELADGHVLRLPALISAARLAEVVHALESRGKR